MYCQWTVIVLVSSFSLCFIQAMIERIPLPNDLHGCYEFKSKNISAKEVSAKKILDFCMNTYLLDNHLERLAPQQNISENAKKYLASLFRQIEGEMHDLDKKNKSRRTKRQLFRQDTWRIRNEIRTLSPREWDRVTNALNRLKRDYSIDRSISTFDMISYIHTGPVLEAAHGGPNFYGWHTIYLLVLETAMRVPLPYWDSTMDQQMTDPTSSMMWSSRFFGNGDGAVVTGPFSSWITRLGTRIIRNLGSGSDRLMTEMSIRLLMSRSRMSEICEPLSGFQARYSFEAHHNGVHNYIDGYLAHFHTSTYDPIFFFHHSFVHMLWLQFKRRQRMLGINPQRDYPRGANVPSAHRWYRLMDFLPFSGRVRHIDGYSDRYDNMVRYGPRPRCPSCGNNRYLYCHSQRGICLPRAMRRGVRRRPMISGRARNIEPYGHGFNRFPIQTRPTLPSPFRRFHLNPSRPRSIWRSFNRIPFGHRGKRSVGENLSTNMVTDTQGDTTEEGSPAVESSIDQPYQNTFMINNNSDVKLWVFFPVTIIYEKPKSSQDVMFILYKDEHRASFKEGLQQGLKEHMDNETSCFISPSGAAKLYVQSDGLNYLGRYKDYTKIDERQPITSVTLYVGVKKPAPKEDSHVLLTAYDSCGRACRAMCLVRDSNPVRYEFCPGTFKISDSDPMMYSSSYEKVVDTTLGLENIKQGIKMRDKHTVVTFVCDFKNSWPWQF